MSTAKLPDYTTQLPGAHQVVSLGPEDVRWSYDADPSVEPRRFFGTKKAYQTKVNPMPGYSHDISLVESLLNDVHEKAPLCAPVTINVLSVIDGRGTNGWAQQQWEYYNCYTPDDCQCDVIVESKDGTKVKKRTRNWEGIIVLSGRTTEIHPAIARYVVPHEYGHIVEDQLGIIRYDNDKMSDHGVPLIKEWAKVRGIDDKYFGLSYSPQTHHLVPSEVFANDFRFATGHEKEWWPHDEVVPALGKRGTAKAVHWWNDALDQLKECHETATKELNA